MEEATEEDGLGVLAITHHGRLFEQLRSDVVHVFADGRVQETGGPGLVAELEDTGHERWAGTDQPASVGGGARVADPFADPLA